MNLLLYIAAFIVALGILVVVHEFGHFWVARLLGVKVLRFSVGFGKPLWRRRVGRDQMELVVASLPLGGYVKMLDETEGEVPKAELDRAFNRQPVWSRIAIVLAGPMFNFAFAILAYWLVFVVGVDGLKPVVGRVAPDTPAAAAGFQAGDEILAIDDQAVISWDQRRLYLFRKALARERVRFEVRDAQGRESERVLDLSDFPVARVNASLIEAGIGLQRTLPEILPVIGLLDPGPAADAGLAEGDEFIEIGGKSIKSWADVRDVISAHPGQPLHVVVRRGGERKEVTVTPKPHQEGDKTVGRIHIRPKLAAYGPEMLVRVQLNPFSALWEATRDTWSMSVLTIEMLYRMLKLEVSTRNISGPLTIAQYAGESAKIGTVQFIFFLAIISVSLGVINLLPIPVLDGGHLLYYAIEIVKGSPLSERAMIWGQQFGIAVLIGLMTLAFYNDITRIFN